MGEEGVRAGARVRLVAYDSTPCFLCSFCSQRHQTYKEECIPVRLYLGGNDLTPSYRNVQNKFSVKYFLNLVLVDTEDRRYFKQQELVLWRKKIG